MALIELTTISYSMTMSENGSCYKLDGHISVEASRIEVLEPLKKYNLFEEDVEKSQGTMNGTATQIRTYSGYTCIVAESDTYIKTLMH